MREPLFDRALAPLLLFFLRGLALARTRLLQLLAKLHEPLRRIRAAIEQHVFHEVLQRRLDLLVNLKHPRVHDAHVHARADRVVKKRAVHSLAHVIVAAETERDVRHATAHFRVRQVRFDPARRLDEIDRVVVVLLHAGRDREDVRIENDVLRREADLIHEEAIRPLADADFFRVSRRLPLLVERHHHDRRAIMQNLPRVLAELRFALLHRDRVHDPLPLQTFQPGLDHLPLRRIHHERHLRDLRFAAEQLQEARHRRDAVDHSLVHADVDDVGPVLHLLPCDRHRLLVVPLLDQLRKLRRPRDVRPLADH